MKYIRSGSFKRLFSIRSRSLGEENDEGQPKGVSDKHGTEEKIWAFTEVETEHSRRPSWKCFSFEEIFIATNGFSPDNLVGKGGCIEVFKGILSDGRTVAVKNLTKATTEERREREFLAEIGTIGHVSHPKVSSLLGYCIENGLFLIFCFSTMGSVASCLHGRKIKTEVGFRMEYLRTGSFKWLLPPISCGGFQVEENQGGDGERRQRFFDQYRTKEARGGLREVETEEIKRPSWKCFSYEEIFLATNGFSSDYLVGKGGSSEVYKGIQSDGQILAVKKLKRTSRGGRSEREFLTEIGTIGHVSHPNVSSLLGYCIENGLFLIFRFYPRGSVASCLHDGNSPPLEWKIRYKIAVGTARGLHYLHRGCKRRIIHRDIKASNILLSEDYEPQISDFGLAKWLPTQWTHHSIGPIEGTVGYLAPEYFSHGIVDEKTDVFAFGVFLLQLISGKKPVDASHRSLRAWAKPYLKQGEIQKLIDPRLDGAYDQTQLKQLAFAASLCVRASSTRRPTIAQVLEIMETGNIDIERWAMPEKEEKQEDVWASEDLECDCDSSFSSSTGRK